MFFFIIRRIDKIEKTAHDNKASGLNNLKTYVLTHKRFKNYLVSVFSGLSKAQIHKIPYTDSLHHESKILMSFKKLSLCKPNEYTEVYLKIIFFWETI